MINQNWKDCSIVAFDLETTGACPIGAEICEIGAVKWKNGVEIDSFHTLIKPDRSIPAEVIKIHGITNEMVAQSPRIKEVIGSFHEFIGDSLCVAHHAPFDMGFLAVEFEKAKLNLPLLPVFCSSLLARKIITESPNHKLQTLIKVLNIPGGTAHRALDDARACMHLAQIVFERIGNGNATPEEILQNQKHQLYWKDFGVQEWREAEAHRALIDAIEKDKEVEILYHSNKSSKATWRKVHPFGAVRSPDGDWLSAFCLKDGVKKRYYMNKVEDSRAL